VRLERVCRTSCITRGGKAKEDTCTRAHTHRHGTLTCLDGDLLVPLSLDLFFFFSWLKYDIQDSSCVGTCPRWHAHAAVRVLVSPWVHFTDTRSNAVYSSHISWPAFCGSREQDDGCKGLEWQGQQKCRSISYRRKFVFLDNFLVCSCVAHQHGRKCCLNSALELASAI